MAPRLDWGESLVAMTIYIEGGGDTRALQAPARRAFKALFERAGLKGRMPTVIACGPRSLAIRAFQNALKRGEIAVLLVDSEGSVAIGSSPTMHLRGRDEWGGHGDESGIHLMVQIMESWFLADPDALLKQFGAGFEAKALPKSSNVETVSKETVLSGLNRAITKCGVRSYTRRKRLGFEIVERLDPNKVEASSPFAKRFFDYLRANS